jgi:MFS family permease
MPTTPVTEYKGVVPPSRQLTTKPRFSDKVFRFIVTSGGFTSLIILGLIALFLLGVGWNFLFTGSTTLSMTAWRPEEKDRAQAAINFCVFATMAVTSFASGALITTSGWDWLNYGSLVPVGLTAFALLWLVWIRKNQTAA